MSWQGVGQACLSTKDSEGWDQLPCAHNLHHQAGSLMHTLLHGLSTVLPKHGARYALPSAAADERQDKFAPLRSSRPGVQNCQGERWHHISQVEYYSQWGAGPAGESTWPQWSAQTKDVGMAFGGNLPYGHKWDPCCCKALDPDMAMCGRQHGTSPFPWWQSRLPTFLYILAFPILPLFRVHKCSTFLSFPSLHHVLAHYSGSNLTHMRLEPTPALSCCK